MRILYVFLITYLAFGNIIFASGSGSEIITFYKVPLVCGAAPDIGCGSRAKPILLEMEQNPAIQEAWLNREGTMYAIVWKENERTEDVAKPIFQSHSIEYTKLNEDEAKDLFTNFRQEGKWLRGAEVDKLSIEEAGRIAEDATKFLIDEGQITKEEGNLIKSDIEAYFVKELVKIRTLNELREDSETKFQEAIIRIYENHLGKDRTGKLIEIYRKKFDEQKENSKDCCDSDCCKK